MKLLALSLLMAMVCADVALCRPVISANINLSNGAGEQQRSEFGHKLPDAISIDILDSIESQSNPTIRMISILGDLFLDLDDTFADEAVHVSQEFAQRLPEALAHGLTESLPVDVRLGHTKLQENGKEDDKQDALIGVFGDSNKLHLLINQIASSDLTHQLIDILEPLSRRSAKMLIEDLNSVISPVSDIIKSRKPVQQWVPQLKEATQRVLTKNSNLILSNLQKRLEERIPDFVIDKVGEALGAGNFTKAIIRTLLGDTIKKEVSKELTTLSDMLVSRFGTVLDFLSYRDITASNEAADSAVPAVTYDSNKSGSSGLLRIELVGNI
ncbi:hypothetical protein BDF22DRAFT_678636 [Syncephalis plumigaleata]|nr:hypothetical protein BDF22DRAFT_678636 [Syncephalis plumigaleata]